MSSKLRCISGLVAPTTSTSSVLFRQLQQSSRYSTPSAIKPVIIDRNFLRKLLEKEKSITKQKTPVRGGPRACAQAYLGRRPTVKLLEQIKIAELRIRNIEPLPDGPAMFAQMAFGLPSEEDEPVPDKSGAPGENSPRMLVGNNTSEPWNPDSSPQDEHGLTKEALPKIRKVASARR